LNENLRRALLRARLSDEDVAARLGVDPKTVRRWLEGRVPYLRHRWALASMLDLDETDLWPQMRATRSRPEEVRAVYPHRDGVPRAVWRDLFYSAEREISILAESALFLAEDPRSFAVLRDRGQAGVRMRVCLRDPDWPGAAGLVARTRTALSLYEKLHESGGVELRVHRVSLNNSIYHADDKLLIVQRAFGVPARRASVLYLRRTDSGDMFTTYLESFDDIWGGSSSVA
jgi:transcriptional regulator with XRE-family HTH domain